MTDLLTAKDVEFRVFKKVSFGGYSVPDVEEFLNQVADDLEAYALRAGEQQRRLYELGDAVKQNEAMKDTIKDALILAQKSAREKEEETKRQVETIVSKAEAKLHEVELEIRRRQEEAESVADDIVAEARATAAQVLKEAEETRLEAQKRLDGIEAEINRRVVAADERASEMTAEARARAQRIAGDVRQEIEGRRLELVAVRSARQEFLRSSAELAEAFAHQVEEAKRKAKEEMQEWDETEAFEQSDCFEEQRLDEEEAELSSAKGDENDGIDS